jgi:purine-binding chemotaxis protein CheW
MAPDRSQQLVVFSLGAEEYALPIGEVQEIIHYTEPRSVASKAPWIRGVISLRGKIIPVCDLATRLGVASNAGEASKIVVVERESGIAGVIVDDVAEVLTIEPDQLDEAPAAGAEIVEGVVQVGDRLVVVLSADGIFGDVQAAATASV